MNETAIHSVIGAFYESAFDPSRLRDAMSGLVHMAGAVSCNWLDGDMQRGIATIVECVGLNPEAVAQYHGNFFRLDPLAPLTLRTPTGVWMNDWREFGPHGYAGTEYYNDFIKAHDMHSVLSVVLYREAGRGGLISLQRAAGCPEFSRHDEQLLSQVLPHIQNTARLMRETEALRQRVELSEAVLNYAGRPVWVIDSTSRVALANDAARTDNSGAWRVIGDHLLSVHDPVKFSAATRAATQPVAPRASWVDCRGRNGELRPYLVAPVTAASRSCAAFQRPMAVVVATGKEDRSQPVAAALAALYGLTPREACVAAHVGAGLSPQEVAQRLGVSLPTVRAQLRIAYSKLGINRQGELAQVVQHLQIG